MSARSKTVAIALLTMAFLWANLEAYPSPNAMSNILLAYRFVTEGTANISGFDEIPAGFRNWETTDGYPEYNRFGPGTALALSPAVAVAIAAGVQPRDIGTWGYIDKAVATLLVVVAAIATFAAARRISGDGAAVLATFAAVAGTSIATIASQRTWQHPAGLAAVAIAWLWVVRGQVDERWLARAGLPLALAITVRYPLAVIWLACLAYLAFTHRRVVIPYLLWSAGPLIFLAIYTRVVFGSPVSNSYGPQLWQWAGLIGLPGNLISPSRGLLVYSPFLVAGLWAIGRRAWQREPLWWFALASCVGMWLVHGSYIGWWGGWSYGNRYLLEVVPIIASGVAVAWRGAGARWRYVLVASILFAVMIQVAGLLAYYHFWNGFNWDDAHVQVSDADAARAMWALDDPQWWWTVRAAIATADIRAAILVPITLAFGYFAFRAGLARPTTASAQQQAA
jgi:hypothetical protein